MGIYPIAEVPAFEYSVEGLVIAIRRLIKYRIFRIFQEPVFECTLEKETWLDMINFLEPFTESSVMSHEYLTNCGEIDLLISPDRDW